MKQKIKLEYSNKNKVDCPADPSGDKQGDYFNL